METIEAVKDICEQNRNVGIACAMKNAGVGVGIPDTGRCIVAVKDGKLHIRSGASCIGQGLGTVLTQIVCTMLHCGREDVVYEAANTVNAPDSGTTSGSGCGFESSRTISSTLRTEKSYFNISSKIINWVSGSSILIIARACPILIFLSRIANCIWAGNFNYRK